MDSEIYKFNNVDPDDISDVLLKIQESFNIRFDNDGLKEVTNFGSLCDLIHNKINLEHTDSCSTQHAFYMLRNAIATATGADRCSIKPTTRLSTLFPRDNRLQLIAEIEQELGFSINLLKPKQWVINLFSIILAASVIGLFYSWQAGICGILASALSLRLAGKFGKEIHLKTMGDLANNISKESYLKARRNPCTVNRKEIEQKVKELFANDLQLKPVLISRESQF